MFDADADTADADTADTDFGASGADPSDTPDHVAVVGGGIVGSSVAYHLARAGVETTLYDRRDEGRATDAGAGIVSPATSSRTGSSAWFDLAVRAADYYPDLAAALEADGAADHGYGARDLLSVAIDDDELDPFAEAKARTERRADQYGVPAPESFEEVSVERARDVFPPLGDAQRALLYRDQARVDGTAFASALREAGETHGLTVEEADVTDVRTDGRGAVEGVVADGAERSADAVVVAGGAWSPAFGDALGVEVPVVPQRGQILHLDVGGGDGSAADTADWPIVSAFRHKYFVPWDDGHVAVGATREDGVGFEPRTTVEGVHEVTGETLRVASGLADAEVREVKVGLRPLSRDGLPVLGPAPDVPGAYIVTGHGPTGLTLGPYSGRLVAELVRGADPDPDLSAFLPTRFR